MLRLTKAICRGSNTVCNGNSTFVGNLRLSHPPLAKDAQITSDLSNRRPRMRRRSLKGVRVSCTHQARTARIRRDCKGHEENRLGLSRCGHPRDIHFWGVEQDSEGQGERRERRRRRAFATALRDLRVERHVGGCAQCLHPTAQEPAHNPASAGVAGNFQGTHCLTSGPGRETARVATLTRARREGER